jgi:hypothetical protein
LLTASATIEEPSTGGAGSGEQPGLQGQDSMGSLEEHTGTEDYPSNTRFSNGVDEGADTTGPTVDASTG